MLFYFFIVLGAGAAMAIIAISWRQLAYVRTHELTELSPGEEFIGDILQRRIDIFYFSFSHFFASFVHYSYLYSLLALRRFIVIARFLLTRVERKFSRLIDSVHGRSISLHRGGPVSPFLVQLKNPESEQ